MTFHMHSSDVMRICKVSLLELSILALQSCIYSALYAIAAALSFREALNGFGEPLVSIMKKRL
jgi:hypothetical protein